ncbi:RNA-directed DNA polymerase (reverse transcriptase)-related family protein [Rhynchospora pubera]|uniref:RNA-directed DNA polymerase (Reverse transcriptase)-related family protein n=1 Tax=Rhynchospora pubera TaxID=906938 RepID=A0AAV8FMU3_9POAL|nr:RNA-directed DNA polymerase (reverse transcriptase)-related family protein [Rhynchospora pubera]
MSGQMIGVDKSRIWFSKRATTDSRTFCMRTLQATQGEERHVYLGVPILASKCSHFDYLLEKVDAKLSVWKAKLLSPTAKVVLIKSVVEPMLLYTMGAGPVPGSIFQRINTKIRGFFWNSGAKHKMRLVAWEKITAPKNCGGLGLRDATTLGQAMIMKILWKLAAREYDEALWVRVLKAKYLSRSTLWLASTPSRCFRLWRALLDCRDLLQPHVKWIIGDGKTCSLIGDPWHHFWLRFSHQSSAIRTLTVADCIDQNTGQWNSNLLISAVGFHGALFIACVYQQPPLHHGRSDRLIFTPSNSGRFSFKGACNLLQHNTPHLSDHSDIWKVVWRCPGILPRIRLFLWKLLHDDVPVKSVFARMMRVQPPPCELCGLDQDSALHALFLCPIAEQSWLTSAIGLRVNALPADINQLVAWLSKQLTHQDFMRFANHLWAFWKARCKEVYEGKKIMVQQVSCMANSYTFLANLGDPPRRSVSTIREEDDNYRSVVEGLYCRMDGSYQCQGNSGWAYTLYNGSVLVEYGLGSGTADSPLHAEALAMHASLRAALAAGWSAAIFQTDCQVLANVINGFMSPETVDWTAYITILGLIATFKQYGDFLCCYVPRGELQLEHSLANHARIFDVSMTGYSFPSFPQI